MTAQQLLRLCTDIGIRSLKLSGAEITGCCPIHREENPSWAISATKQYHPWNCFVCGGGDVVSLVGRALSINKDEARNLIAKYGTISLPDLDIQIEKDRIPFGNHFIEPYLIDPKRFQYHDLKKETIERCSVGYDKFAERYIIPWYHGDKLLGLTSHTWKSDKKRTIKALPLHGFNHHSTLYLPTRELKKKQRVIAVEGPADAMRLMEFGFHRTAGVVAFAGSSPTEEQLLMIRRSEPKVLIWMGDPDRAGMKGAIVVRERMKQSCPIMLAKLKRADPCDSTRVELVAAIATAEMML